MIIKSVIRTTNQKGRLAEKYVLENMKEYEITDLQTNLTTG